jgi:hypothetical protein
MSEEKMENKCQIQIFPKQKVLLLNGQAEDLVSYTLGEPSIWVEKKPKGECYSCYSCNKKYVKYGWFIKHLLARERKGIDE